MCFLFDLSVRDIFLFCGCPPVFLIVGVPVCHCVCLLACLSFLSVCLSVFLPACLSGCLSVCLSVRVCCSVCCLSVCPCYIRAPVGFGAGGCAPDSGRRRHRIYPLRYTSTLEATHCEFQRPSPTSRLVTLYWQRRMTVRAFAMCRPVATTSCTSARS